MIASCIDFWRDISHGPSLVLAPEFGPDRSCDAPVISDMAKQTYDLSPKVLQLKHLGPSVVHGVDLGQMNIHEGICVICAR